MAITTRDGLIAACAAAEPIRLFKTASRTSVAAIPFSVFDLAGSPAAGTLAGASTAAGVVPDDATAGCPNISAFSGANLGYIVRAEATSPVACRLAIYDLLFKAGAYAFNANTTLAAQPAFTSRIPTADKRTEIWIECVTAFTGNPSIAVTYTNESGTAARTTGTIATGVAPTVGRLIKLPLQLGDYGVQKIESVVATVATVGTFNVLVMRKLWEGRIKNANDHIVHGFDLTGLRQVYTNSALVMVVNADSTATSTPEVCLDIGNG